MDRRDFLGLVSGSAAAGLTGPLDRPAREQQGPSLPERQASQPDLVIAGGGLGGVAAAIAALRNNLTVVLTEETDWIGGQLTAQGVPPDEHPWIETHGAPLSYRQLRDGIRAHYLAHYPLTDDARGRQHLNPGNGAVSRLCHEPKAALAVLKSMLAPYESTGRLRILTGHRITSAEADGRQVRSLTARSVSTGRETRLSAPCFVDATELGELLPLTGTAYVSGAEGRGETGETHAAEKADPANQQAFTVCFAMDYEPGGDHVIEKPADYSFWRNHVPKLQPAWPGRLLDLTYTHPSSLAPKRLGFHPEGHPTGDTLNLWNYRRIIDKGNFIPGTYIGDISLVNWPQNDYMLGNLVDVPDRTLRRNIEAAKQLSLSLLYWLQTEVERPDGGKGWRGLRLRKDIMDTEDGLAKYPYVRESRRIRAVTTVTEKETGKTQSGGKGSRFDDSVGLGYYQIDLHPSTRGDNYIDFPAVPFQIPLGALLPVKMDNLLPACKNIGSTHVTNGCYRLHPVEWGIGEAVGCLVAFAREKRVAPREVRANPQLLSAFRHFIREQGVETDWPVT